jgi:hypothetical protein
VCGRFCHLIAMRRVPEPRFVTQSASDTSQHQQTRAKVSNYTKYRLIPSESAAYSCLYLGCLKFRRITGLGGCKRAYSCPGQRYVMTPFPAPARNYTPTMFNLSYFALKLQTQANRTRRSKRAKTHKEKPPLRVLNFPTLNTIRVSCACARSIH